MRFVIQRVTTAQVEVGGEIVGKIDNGFLVLVGVREDDTKEIADKMVAKMIKLRIFDDADGKTNLDIHSVNGNLLLISQFTLYADCKKGNRPSFIHAGAPDHAEDVYNHIVNELLVIPEKADERHKKAIIRMTTAYFKLLYPHITSVEDVNLEDFDT